MTTAHPRRRVSIFVLLLCACALASSVLVSTHASSLRAATAGCCCGRRLRRQDAQLSAVGVARFADPKSVTTKARARNAPKNDEESNADPPRITGGSVVYEGGDLAYYHCGPLPSADGPDPMELVLLHGASFTKEKWRSSEILDMLCAINDEKDGGKLSVSALDLPVKADGRALESAFDALASRGVLSGRAAVFVSPSASGKALVSLGEMADGGGDGLPRVVRAWIPVAAGAVLGASDAALLQYKTANIPILAIHGDRDAMGKKATERLMELNGAGGIELQGRHPVYLDSPEDFVAKVLRFLDETRA